VRRAHAVNRPLLVGVIVLAAAALVLNLTVIGGGGAGGVADAPVGSAARGGPAPVVAWSASILGEPLGEGGPDADRGGILRHVAAIDRLRHVHPGGLIVLDAGSVNAGVSPVHRLATRTIYEALSIAGVDACNVGRGEQLLGADALRSIAAPLGIRFVSLNVNRLDGSPVDQRYVVVETARGRTLVTGVAHEVRVGGAARTMRVADPAAALGAFLPQLERIDHDHAVLLADVSAATLLELAPIARGFTLVLGGAEALGSAGGGGAPGGAAALAVRGTATLGVARLDPAPGFRAMTLDDTLAHAERVEPLAAEYLREVSRLPRLTAEPERVRSRAGGSTYGFDDPEPDPDAPARPPEGSEP
jgi:hypothetical protein